MNRAFLLLLAATSMVAPIVADAGAACAILQDPVGDLVPVDARALADPLDLVGTSMTVGSGVLTARIEVRDLGAAPAPRSVHVYAVSWRRTDARVEARATRSPSGWTYSLYGPGVAVTPLDGSADRRADAVEVNVPLELASPDGAGLADITARTALTVDGATPMTDVAPNHPGGPRIFALDGTCATSVTEVAAACSVLTHAPGHGSDAGLRSVSFATTPVATLVTIEADHAAGSADRWEIAWTNPRSFDGDEQQLVWAERSGERIEFGYGRGWRYASALGWFGEGTITVMVPRAHLRLVDGTRLTDVTAVWYEHVGSAWAVKDALPDEGGSGSWVVGAGCAALEVQPCPVVLDRPGDARYAEVTDEVPENYAGLDLRAVGVRTSGETITLAARVADLRAPDPPGAEVSGWTISWLDRGRRVYAQAERDARGLVFRYGARAADGEAPMGPSFAGRATSGRLDPAGVVEIDVPRALMPSSGTRLGALGATAWGLSGRHSGAVYLVWDETASRPYLAGASCAV